MESLPINQMQQYTLCLLCKSICIIDDSVLYLRHGSSLPCRVYVCAYNRAVGLYHFFNNSTGRKNIFPLQLWTQVCLMFKHMCIWPFVYMLQVASGLRRARNVDWFRTRFSKTAESSRCSRGSGLLLMTRSLRWVLTLGVRPLTNPPTPKSSTRQDDEI